MTGNKKGFSLVEIVIALGIVAFALVAILGLFPVALGQARESVADTHAALIAQLIVGQIRSLSASDAALAVGPTPTNSTGNLVVTLGLGRSYFAIYDQNGQPVSQATAAQFANPPSGMSLVNQSQCAYQVMLTVEADTPTVGLSRLTVDVTYPGLAPTTARKTNSFITLVKNTGS